MMMGIDYSEQVHHYPRDKKDLGKFKTDWAAGTYDPAGALCFRPEDVEELEVLCEEIVPPEWTDPPEPREPEQKKHRKRRRK